MPEKRNLPPLVETGFGREKFPAEAEAQEKREKIKQLRKELKEAEKAGDDQRKEQIHAQIGELSEGLREKGREFLEQRSEKLAEVKDFPPDMRLKSVKIFKDLFRDLNTTRKAFRKAKDKGEKAYWGKQFAGLKKKMDFFLDNPQENEQLEKAYLAWTESKVNYARFLNLETRLSEVEKELAKPSFSGESKKVSDREMARMERISRRQRDEAEEEIDGEIEALGFLYSEKELAGKEGKKEFEEISAEIKEESGLEDKRDYSKMSKAELEEEKKRIEGKLDEMWENEMTRYHEGLNQLEKLLNDLNEGKDVLETPSVISSINKLAEWERLHERTTIGGVLVGEPGTGKTTLVHHYLEERGRNYVYLDLSEEVTRYMLFGTKALEFKSPTDYFKELANQIGEMNEKEFRDFVKKNGNEVAKTYGMDGEEAEATFFAMLQEELVKAEEGTGAKEDLARDLRKAQERMKGTVGEKYREELAKKFKHLVQKNGWRDGVIIAALRRGDSVLLDEFVKSRDLTLLYGLMTAKPGEKWYFEDNDEQIEIPDTWKMYFTANIGRRHGAYRVAEALASRAQGKVMEVDYPPTSEELTVGLAELCDAEGVFLRDKKDIASMTVLIGDVFPKVRELLRDKEGTIPVSWRTIRDIGEKLVQTKEVHGRKIRQKTGKNFDEAAYEVLIESYKLYEDKTVPREIVNICTSLGLMLDDKLKRKIVNQERWLAESEFEKRKELKEESEEVWEDIVKKLKGEMAMTRSFTAEGRPERVSS